MTSREYKYHQRKKKKKPVIKRAYKKLPEFTNLDAIDAIKYWMYAMGY